MTQPERLDRGQRTLFDLKKVVSSKSTWGCFSPEEITVHRQVLLEPSSSKHQLLNVLRKLDCYRLQLSDVQASQIGRAAATLAARHPREEVSRLAGALVDKWRSQLGPAAGEAQLQLFEEVGYDAAAAAEAPEGNPADFQVAAPPPPPPPQPTRVQPPRKERAQRLKEEDAFLEGSDFEGISESDSESEGEEEDDWQPGKENKAAAGGRRKSGGAPGGSAARSKKART